MSHRVTIICDQCGEEYLMDNEMELPPYWMGVPVSMANGDGIINGREHFIHICSLDCLAEYASGDVMKEKLMTVDKDEDDEDLFMAGGGSDEDDD